VRKLGKVRDKTTVIHTGLDPISSLAPPIQSEQFSSDTATRVWACLTLGILIPGSAPGRRELSRTRGRGLRNLFGDHLEAREPTRAERGHDSDVGGVAPTCH